MPSDTIDIESNKADSPALTNSLKKTNRLLTRLVAVLAFAMLLALGALLAVSLTSLREDTKSIDRSNHEQVPAPLESARGHPLATHQVHPVLHGLVHNHGFDNSSGKPVVGTLPCASVVAAMDLVAAGEYSIIFDRVNGSITTSYLVEGGDGGGLAVFADHASFGIANARVQGATLPHTVTCSGNRGSCTLSSPVCTVTTDFPFDTAFMNPQALEVNSELPLDVNATLGRRLFRESSRDWVTENTALPYIAAPCRTWTLAEGTIFNPNTWGKDTGTKHVETLGDLVSHVVCDWDFIIGHGLKIGNDPPPDEHGNIFIDCQWRWYHTNTHTCPDLETVITIGRSPIGLRLFCRHFNTNWSEKWTWVAIGKEVDQSCCHPASSTVELADGAVKQMDSLSVGDMIRTPTGFQPVLGFLHQERDAVGEYFHFTTADGATIAISAHHHLVVDGEWRDPATVRLGMKLTSALAGRDVAVIAIEQTQAKGAYHPFVRGGEYYADGLLATDYNAHVPHFVWSLARSYVALRYHLGVPVIPEGHGQIFPSPFWAYDSVMDPLGVPTFVQWLLSPLLVGTVIVSELLNLAAAAPQRQLAAAIAGLAAYAIRNDKAKKA